MEIVQKLKKGNEILEITICEDPANPREDSNLGIITASHRRYNFSDDEQIDTDNYDGWQEVKEMLIEEKGATHILPVYMLDHSGISLSTSSFGCKWDSGQVGFIYATEDTQKEIGIDKTEKIIKMLKAEIEAYSKYVNGEMYEFIRYEIVKCKCCAHESKNISDQCGSFYEIKDIIDENNAGDWKDITDE